MKTLLCIALLLGALVPLAVAKNQAISTPAISPDQGTSGTLIFHGRYQHWNTGREIPQPSELWLKQTEDGALSAMAEVPFMNSTEIASGNKLRRFVSHRTLSRAADNRPRLEVKLEFARGRVKGTRHGWKDWDGKEFVVPPDALFDPNTRPDSYCAANILLRAYELKPAETKELRVFDLDNSGDGFADYTIQLQNIGKERVEVPAGTFEATHLVLTQKTSADTWFKKRAGHITDFWVLDNQIIVRIRRHREPYEVALLDYSVPQNLPGHVSRPEPQIGQLQPKGQPASTAANPGDYAADWAAFIREVDQTYPFFELKGIRRDWMQAKARLSERVQACGSDGEFLAIITEAIRCLRDAHMGLSQTRVPLPTGLKRYYPGVSFMSATQNRVIVMSTETYAGRLKTGTVVTKIDGRDARTVLEESARQAWGAQSPYPVSVSSPQRARLFAYRWPLLAFSNQTHTISYVAHGRTQELSIACAIEPRGWPHTYCMPTNLTQADRSLNYGRLPSGVGYVYLRSVGNQTAAGLREAVTAQPRAKGWIVDLRGNGGGGYDSNLLAAIQALPRPVVALLDAGCISAGETLARDLAQLAGAHLMGARTAGASSAKRQWRFPSGIASVTFSTRSRWRHDGQPIEFNGIAPDEEIEAVPEEVARGLNSEILKAEQYLARMSAGEKTIRR